MDFWTSAMAIESEMTEGSISSLILDSLQPKHGEDMLSTEDVAWVDSCLIKDPEIADSGLNSLREAFLEILNFQPESLDSTATRSDSFPTGTDIEMLPSSPKAETVQLPGRADDSLVPIIEEVQDISDDLPTNMMINTLHPKIIVENDFQPRFIDGQKDGRDFDSGLNLGFPEYDKEESTEDIFRVWDLDVPAEEHELLKQLNNALTEGSVQPVPSTLNDSGMWKDLKAEPLDDLIASIAGLSLNRNSG